MAEPDPPVPATTPVADDPAFVAAVRSYFGLTPGGEGAIALNEVQEQWLRYALSTNERGDALLAALAPLCSRTNWRGCRVLDVGSGYGGFVRAAARAGADTVGIECDPRLAEISRTNLASLQGVSWRILNDAVESSPLATLGPFDLAVADNVLEHVSDPEATVARLAKALADGGAIYVAVPNPLNPANVLKEPHFGSFGMTLLGHDDAERYFHEAGWQGAAYTVGHYRTAEDYFSWFARAGLDSRLATKTTWWGEAFVADIERLAGLEASAAQVERGQIAALSDPRLSARTRTLVSEAVTAWFEQLRADAAEARSDESSKVLELFLEWYGPQVWHFFATPTSARTGARPITLRSAR